MPTAEASISDPPQQSRRRPGAGRRWLAFGCVGTASVIVVLLFAYLGIANSLPPPEPDTRVLPSPNGYDACKAAVSSLSATAGRSPIADPFGDPAALKVALAPQEPALNAVRKALRLPYLRPATTFKVGSRPDAALTGYRNAARGFAAESRLALTEGQPDVATQHALDAIELGTHVGRGAPVLDNLVGLASITIGLRAAESCTGQLTAEEGRTAGQRLDRILMDMPSVADVFEEERRTQLIELRRLVRGQYSYAAFSGANMPGMPPANRWSETWDELRFYLHPKLRTYHAVDRFYRGVISECAKPAAQRSLPDETGDWLGDLFATPDTSTNAQLEQARAAMRLLRGELALAEFRAAHGSYPASLTELAGVPPLSLTDPFSGQPLRYRRTGASYLLYSIGPDGKDDGGKPMRLMSTSSGDLVAGKLFSTRLRPKPAARNR